MQRSCRGAIKLCSLSLTNIVFMLYFIQKSLVETPLSIKNDFEGQFKMTQKHCLGVFYIICKPESFIRHPHDHFGNLKIFIFGVFIRLHITS